MGSKAGWQVDDYGVSYNVTSAERPYGAKFIPVYISPSISPEAGCAEPGSIEEEYWLNQLISTDPLIGYHFRHTERTVKNITSKLVANPNLLINSNFAINQRGQSTYAGTSNGAYSVDRWKLRYSCMYNVSTKNITFTAQYSQIIQEIENYTDLIGKTVSFTVNISDYVSQNDDLYLLASGSSNVKITGNGTFTLTYTVPSNITYLRVGVFRTSTTGNTSCTLNWAKLEIGDIATPYIPPLIAEELPKCQRYYVKIDTSNAGNKYQIYRFARSNYALYDAQVFFPVRMRTRPTVALFSTNTDTEGYLYNITQTTDQQFSVGYITTDGFQFGNKSGNMEANNAITGYYSADAEIY